MKKKILFVTGTRADFGKLKSLIKITKKSKKFSVYIIVTGMHMMHTFGDTHTEITKFFNICLTNPRKKYPFMRRENSS